MPAIHQQPGAMQHRALAVHDALGPPGAARGEHDEGRRALGDRLPRRRTGGAGGDTGQPIDWRVGDHRGEIAGGHQRLDALRRVRSIDGDARHPGGKASEQGDRAFRSIRQPYADRPARRRHSGDGAAERLGLGDQLPVGDASPPILHRDGAGRGGSHSAEQGEYWGFRAANRAERIERNYRPVKVQLHGRRVGPGECRHAIRPDFPARVR